MIQPMCMSFHTTMSLQFHDVETYLSQRSAFIQADRALRRENGRLGVLTEKEKQGDAIIRQIRKDEESSVWAKDYDGIPHPFPGMEFLTGARLCCLPDELAR